MKKFFICCFVIFLGSRIFAVVTGKKSISNLRQPPELPESLSENISHIKNTAFSSDGEWYFINAEKASGKTEDKINTLYSLNTRTGEYHKIFENTGYDGINRIHFFSKTQKLYFIINNGGYKKNNVQTFEGFGIYTLQKDSDGNYTSRGLKRYAAPPNWIFKDLGKAYLFNTESPDYQGFLDYLYGFADTRTNPIFGIKKNDGIYVYEKEALQYLYEKNRFNDFINEHRGKSIFPIEKYLFARDKNGNPTAQTAYTNNGSKKFEICEGRFVTKSYFVEADGHLYFFITTGSSKNVGKENETWTYDYSTVYEVHDDDTDFYFSVPAEFGNVKATIYDNDLQQPIYAYKNQLVINDVDGETKWILLKDGLHKFTDKKGFLGLIQNVLNEFENPVVRILFAISIFLFICVIISAVLLLRILFGKTTTKRQRIFAYKIQEAEKQKIAKDIHDTIVQDIRAVRIDAEMLSVDEKSKQKQNELVEKITECIVKMRNICYGLSPAELSLQSQSGDAFLDKFDFLSIINTLCTQFTTQTKIPCRLNIDGEMKSAMLPKEKCENLVRIIQEAFRNIEKHSYATEVQVLIREEICNTKNEDEKIDKKFLTIFIIDDGKGCDLKEALSKKSLRQHFGLRSMKERMQMIGGEISFRSELNDGMQVKLRFAQVNSE